MKILLHVSTGKNVVLYLLILISFGLLGCAGVGRVVSVENRILLGEKEISQGNFSHGGLTVEYRYRLAGGNMTLDGQVYYLGDVDSLDVRILFLDAAGTVLQQKIVYSAGYRVSRSSRTERTFQETLVVPTGATGISFSHSVQPRRSYR